jgi:hypothetical protein
VVEVMVEQLREVVVVKVVEVVGVVKVHQRLGHLSQPFLLLRQKQLWLLRSSSWSKGLLPWQVSNIDHIQEARLPHLMGEIISFIWLM